MKLEKNAYSVKILFGKQINGKQLKKCEVLFHFFISIHCKKNAHEY